MLIKQASCLLYFLASVSTALAHGTLRQSGTPVQFQPEKDIYATWRVGKQPNRQPNKREEDPLPTSFPQGTISTI
jgi:hypothetical protein